jgi:hypothetical protein
VKIEGAEIAEVCAGPPFPKNERAYAACSLAPLSPLPVSHAASRTTSRW